MKIFFVFLFAVIFASCSKTDVRLEEWRGPNRSGIYQETNLLKIWPDSGPGVLWEMNDLGTGYGSPLVLDDRILIMGTRDSIAILFAITLDGQIIYECEVGSEWVVNFPGSRCTPTVVNDQVYIMTGKGQLSCIQLKDGQIEWSRNVYSEFEGEMPRFGYAQSLVVEDNKVYCCPGGETNNVVALDAANGKLIWSCAGKGERPGYHPAKLITVGNRKLFLTFSAYHLLGIDAETGELMWAHEQVNTEQDQRKPGVGDTHANTVLYEDNIIFYVEGDGNCAVALALNDDGSSIQQLWNNAVVDNFMGGILMLDHFLYSCNYSANQLAKIDAKSGAVVESLPVGRGSVIMADDMLYYYNMSGEVHLIAIDDEKMESISSFKITKGSHEHFSHPVIHNGVLYVRHGEYLGAFDIKNQY
ncbi:MAG: PQQ-binding-like beta-propeller repeat protein [Prolixibacteraceae bacterium]